MNLIKRLFKKEDSCDEECPDIFEPTAQTRVEYRCDKCGKRTIYLYFGNILPHRIFYCANCEEKKYRKIT